MTSITKKVQNLHHYEKFNANIMPNRGWHWNVQMFRLLSSSYNSPNPFMLYYYKTYYYNTQQTHTQYYRQGRYWQIAKHRFLVTWNGITIKMKCNIFFYVYIKETL